MVNGLHLYSAFIQSAIQFRPLIHPFTHQQRLAARREQLGARCLAQGHFDTPRVGSNRRPPDDCSYLLSHIAPLLPPEPYRPPLTSWAISPPSYLLSHIAPLLPPEPHRPPLTSWAISPPSYLLSHIAPLLPPEPYRPPLTSWAKSPPYRSFWMLISRMKAYKAMFYTLFLTGSIHYQKELIYIDSIGEHLLTLSGWWTCGSF